MQRFAPCMVKNDSPAPIKAISECTLRQIFLHSLLRVQNSVLSYCALLLHREKKNVLTYSCKEAHLMHHAVCRQRATSFAKQNWCRETGACTGYAYAIPKPLQQLSAGVLIFHLQNPKWNAPAPGTLCHWQTLCPQPRLATL